MTTKRFVQYSISASIDGEEPIDDDSITSEELKTWYEEDAAEILMDSYAAWYVDVQVVEREID